jgi:hypothetical protein
MKKNIARTVVGFLTFLLLSTNDVLAQENVKWQNLFDGKTLDGWEQLNGTATYEVKEGMIMGTTVLGSPNSFLCTQKKYGNFILELDFKVDEGLNSGIQIRSKSLKDYQNGRVHGYQVEIDPAQKELYSSTPPNQYADGAAVPDGNQPRRWTGGIYDEGRRGWLCDLTRNVAARLAFKPDEWNHFRIEAIGDGIRTWINGVFAAGLADAMTPNGFIALQVHAVKEEKPMHIYWKNLRIQDIGVNDAKADSGNDPFMGNWQSLKTGLVAQVAKLGVGKYRALLLNAFDTIDPPVAVLEGSAGENNITLSGDGWTGTIQGNRFKGEKGKEKFEMRHVIRNSPTLNVPPPKDAIVLFDGSIVDEWAKQKQKEWTTRDGPATTWKIIPGGRLEVVPGAYSIITKKEFGDYKLHVEFRLLGEVTNGGIYLQSRYEVNIKDSYGQIKGAPCAALGNVADPANPASMINAAAPPFQWQTLDIEFRAPRFDESAKNKIENAKITVVLNGITLYKDVQPLAMKGAVARLGEAPTGPIMLQEHGTAYQFRNIWLVEKNK